MAPLVSTIEIGRRPEEVFAFVTDPQHFAEWQHDVVGVRILGGSRFTTTRRITGAERTMTQQVTRNDPPRSWVARGIDGPVRPHATITVEPIDDGRSEEHTSELQSRRDLVCRLLLEKKKKKKNRNFNKKKKKKQKKKNKIKKKN